MEFASTIRNKINFLKACYREDNYDVSISNVAKLKKDHKHWLKEKDFLSSDLLPRVPITHTRVKAVEQSIDQYKKERLFIYGSLFVLGPSPDKRGAELCSPIIYFPAQLESENDDYFARINTDDLRVNWRLLKSLVCDEHQVDGLDFFPKLTYPLTNHTVLKILEWFAEYSVVKQVDNAILWPDITDLNTQLTDSRKKSLELVSASGVFLAERGRGTRGILHELTKLTELNRDQDYSSSLQGLLGSTNIKWPKNSKNPHCFSSMLSLPQRKALSMADTNSISVISGPPGTGKSFTIAAMATQAMLNHSNVLVVANTNQAVDVVAKKLKNEFGLDSGIIHTNTHSIKKYFSKELDQILNSATDINPGILRRVSERLIERNEQLIEFASTFPVKLSEINKLGRLNALNKLTLLKRIERAYLKFKNRNLNTRMLSDELADYHRVRESFYKDLAKFINLEHQNDLNSLLETHRRDLLNYRKAIMAQNSANQKSYFENIDKRILFKAFPIWIVEQSKLSDLLPFEKEIFDLVIFDEASQSDVASAIPAIHRSKRAVIIGDTKQLKHVSFLAYTREQELSRQYANEWHFSYRQNSLMDLALDQCENQSQVCFLNEHFRSHPDLIRFSNQQFYGSRLCIMRSNPELNLRPSLEVRAVNGIRDKDGVNHQEVESLVATIKSIIIFEEDSKATASIGVISPFRAQVEYIQKKIDEEIEPTHISKHDIKISTPYGFQGDERDIMLISIAADSQQKGFSAYLNKEDMFNVMVTRAKNKQYFLHSLDNNALPKDHLINRYLEDSSAKKTRNRSIVCGDVVSELIAELRSRNIQHWLNYKTAGVVLDLIVASEQGYVAVDLVGFPGEVGDFFDLSGYEKLNRAGFKVHFIDYNRWLIDPTKCIDELFELIL